MGNFSALFIVALSYYCLWAYFTPRREPTLLYASWLGLTMHHAIAILNAFIIPLSNTWGDPYTFHNFAAGIWQSNRQPYADMLGVIYKILGVSFWLGEECSVLVFAFSIILLAEIAKFVGLEQRLLPVLVIFGMMPSPAIHCSVTLRESYQVFGFLGTIYSLLRLRAAPTWWSFPLLILSLACVVVMHQGLAIFAIVTLVAGVPWALQGRGQFPAVIALVLLTATPLILPKLLDRLESGSTAVKAISEGRIMQYAATYRENIEQARSDYGVSIEQDDFISFSSSIVAVVVMYFIAPLPWQASSVLDFYALFEVVVRCFLIYGCFQQIKQARGEQRKRMIFIMLAAVGLELMWALGTSNWGTALRHHVVAFGAFALLGSPGVSLESFDPGLASLQSRRRRRKDLMHV